MLPVPPSLQDGKPVADPAHTAPVAKVVYDDKTLVGVGQALADGLDCSYICDVAIHPDYQGIGLGKKIIEQLGRLAR